MVSRIVKGRAWGRCLVLGLVGVVFLAAGAGRARASGPDESVLDVAALSQMEQQAASASPREQCFLYTEVVHSLTEMAGRQLEAGEEEEAASTLRHIDAITAKLHQALMADAKRLKNAELLLQHTTRRLGEMVHFASGDNRSKLQATLAQLNNLHSELLAQVFSR